MKKITKIFAAFFAVMICFAAMCCTTAAAANTDLLSVSITADKESYSQGDTLKFDVTVSNKNEYAIEKLELNAYLSESFEITENENLTMQIGANETKTYTISAKPVLNKAELTSSPQTGDNDFSAVIITGVVGIAAIGLMLLTKKKRNSLFSLLLCLTITAAAMPVNSFISAGAAYVAEAEGKKSFKYAEKDYEITVKASYTENENIIIPDVSAFGEMGADGSYNVSEKIEALSGKLLNSSTIKSFTYTLIDANKTLISEGGITVGENWSVENFGLVVGMNIITLTAVDNDGKTYEEQLVIGNSNRDNMVNTGVDMSDNDEDGLIGYYEEWFGTASDNADTDGDGLSDYDEIYKYLTDPTKSDTDDNGVDDANDDTDGDGLSLNEEVELGTDVFANDTDTDGLADGDEINKYNTDPLKEDTDEDGITDGEEAAAGLDPAKADSDDNGVNDNEEVTEQTVSIALDSGNNPAITNASVTLSVPGLISQHVTMRDTEAGDVLSANVVGGVSDPVSIESDVEFNTATITFTYDEALLGDTPVENLAVMWYDEENKLYRIFDKDTVIDTEAHTVSYTTTHFSTYLVVDREIWYDCWREQIDYRTTTSEVPETTYDIGFTVDVSGSMSGDRISKAKVAMNTFIDAMYPQDSACLFTFNSYSKEVASYGTDKETLRSLVSNLIASGGTNTNVGLSATIEEIKANGRDNASKIIIMICDGDVNYQQTTIDAAKEAGIAVYTINVVSGNNSLLQKIADETGGEHYYAATTEEIVSQIENIRGATVDYVDMTDTDGDGLYDVYESKGMKIQNGTVMYSDPTNPDTDGDGATDYTELCGPPTASVFEFAHGNYSCVLGRTMSDPNTADTDGDSVTDNDDLNPYTAARHSYPVSGKGIQPYYVKTDDIDTEFQFINDYEARTRAEQDALFGTYAHTVDFSSYAVRTYAYIVVEGGTLALMENAAVALSWFLAIHGEDKEFTKLSMASLISTGEGMDRYVEQSNNIREFCQDVLKDGATITVASGNSFRSYTDNLNGYNAINWTATLGTASGAAAATLTKDGTSVSGPFRYFVYDYYDWDIDDDRTFIPGLPNASLAYLHMEGMARSYFQFGEFYDYILW